MKGSVSPVTFTRQEAALAILKMATMTIRTKGVKYSGWAGEVLGGLLS